MTDAPPNTRLRAALSLMKTPSPAVKNEPNLTLLEGVDLTEEQDSALKSSARRLKIQAFAGTGKTTLLRAFATQACRAKGLYLAFNASIAAHALTSFPSNIDCRTHNSTALRELGKNDSSWRSLPDGKLDQMTKSHLSSCPAADGLNLQWLLQTIQTFIQSNDGDLTESHFPLKEAVFFAQGDLMANPNDYAKAAKNIWAQMCDPASLLPMPHDGYLKLWSINPRQLPYDFVMIDESQDSNASFLSGMSTQKCRQIYVGDKHQGIYGFRGAVNALDTLMDCETRALTLTHRFGHKLAHLANAVIKAKSSTGFVAPASNAIETQVIFGQAPLGLAPLFLARTNSGLFEKAAQLAEQGKRFKLVGARTKFDFHDLNDLLALVHGDLSSGIYASFLDIDTLAEQAREQGLNDLSLRAKLAKKYRNNLTPMLAAINSKIIPDAEARGGAVSAQLSTIHQAKGLEADWIELLGEFPATALMTRGTPITAQADIEEANIFYVALTRAKKGLATGNGSAKEWAYKAQTQRAFAETEHDLF